MRTILATFGSKMSAEEVRTLFVCPGLCAPPFGGCFRVRSIAPRSFHVVPCALRFGVVVMLLVLLPAAAVMPAAAATPIISTPCLLLRLRLLREASALKLFPPRID